MGMPANEFVCHAVHNVFQGKLTLLFKKAGIEKHNEDQVPELLANAGRVSAMDGFNDFVCFFQEKNPQALCVLSPVPFAAARLAQCARNFFQS